MGSSSWQDAYIFCRHCEPERMPVPQDEGYLNVGLLRVRQFQSDLRNGGDDVLEAVFQAFENWRRLPEINLTMNGIDHVNIERVSAIQAGERGWILFSGTAELWGVCPSCGAAKQMVRFENVAVEYLQAVR